MTIIPMTDYERESMICALKMANVAMRYKELEEKFNNTVSDPTYFGASGLVSRKKSAALFANKYRGWKINTVDQGAAFTMNDHAPYGFWINSDCSSYGGVRPRFMVGKFLEDGKMYPFFPPHKITPILSVAGHESARFHFNICSYEDLYDFTMQLADIFIDFAEAFIKCVNAIESTGDQNKTDQA